MTETDLKIIAEEALLERRRRGEERGLHTTTDFKAEAEKTTRRAAKPKAKRSWRQRMGLD